jgi:hypothetical protein
MIQLGSYALGRHGFFYPDGSIITIPAAGTGSVAGASSRTNKPDPTDPLYIDLGACDDWQDDIKSSGDEKIWKPSPGRRQLYQVIEKGAEATIKMTTEEMQAFAAQVYYRTSQKLTQIGGNQQFNPLSAPPMNGWFHQECYDQYNAFAFSYDVYSLIRITGGMASKEGGIIKPQWEINVLFSTLNTGAVA